MSKNLAHQLPGSEAEGKTSRLSGFKTKSRMNGKVLAAWEAVRGDRLVPRWKDFDPLQVSAALPSCLFLKRIADDNWPILLFGEELVNQWGPEQTGVNGIELFEPEDRPAIIDRMRRLTNDPAIVRSVSILYHDIEEPITVEWLLLPFAGESGLVEYCLMNAYPADDNDQETRRQGKGIVKRILLELEFVDLRAEYRRA